MDLVLEELIDALHFLMEIFCPCSRVIERGSCKAIVIPATGKGLEVDLREQDLSWQEFLSTAKEFPR